MTSTRPSLLRCVQLPTAELMNSELGTITVWRWKVSISVARTLIFLTMPGIGAGDHPVADLERPLGEQDQAGDEVGDDVLQAEADAERQAAGDQREVRQVDAGRRNAEQRGKQDAGIADGGADRVAHAGIDAAARHDRAVEPALEPARHEIADDENEEAGEDAR